MVQVIDTDWNNLDGEDRPLNQAKILHYTAMDHQPHLGRAVDRMKETGQQHWFDSEIKPHWRNDVSDLFEECYQEALEAGLKVETYIPQTPYGPYNKLSQRGYKANHGFDK
jgi:hypothetical protein